MSTTNNDSRTFEPHYSTCTELANRKGLTPLGLMSNYTWETDPKRLGFVLARYKFVAKMLSGYERVAEVGCADAFGTRVVQQFAGTVTAYDVDQIFVDDTNSRHSARWPLTAKQHDMLAGPLDGVFNAIFSLDVFEHIAVANEDVFLQNICDSLDETGVLVIGTPSLESQQYASEGSKRGHVNCKTAESLRSLLKNYFNSVFIFGMNDETLHTGFSSMSHYLLALCCHPARVGTRRQPVSR